MTSRSNLYEIIRSENVYTVSKSSQERGSGLAGEFYTSDDIDTILEDYYTKSELQTSGQSSVHWNNLTNVIDPVITLTGDITGSGTMTNLTSVSFATSISDDAVKSSDIDWGTGANQVDLDEVPDGSTYNRVQSSELVAGIYKDATTAIKGIASFSNSDFTVSSGAVSIKSGVIIPAVHATTHASGGGDPVNHDTLTNFVANEHIDHSGVSITAGAGLTGGGTITASRALDIGSGTGITVNANSIQTNDGQIVHAALSGYTGDEHVAHTTVTIVAGSGLTGGGDITIPRTINVGAGAGIGLTADTVYVSADYTLISSNDAATNVTGAELEELTDGSTTVLHTHSGVSPSAHASSHESGGGDLVDHDNLNNFVANEHVDHSSVTITAGAGLTGGGDITASRTIDIGAGTGITVNANSIQTNDGAIVHDNLNGFVANEHINHSSVTITAGSGLTGGGTIASSRTINVGAGNGISVAADSVAVSYAGSGGSLGSATSVSRSDHYHGATDSNMKVIDLDDWNMDTTPVLAKAHGLTFANIRMTYITIRNDANTAYYMLEHDTGAGAGGFYSIDSTNVNMTRVGSGFFDNANFDSTSYNRGWITIIYE